MNNIENIKKKHQEHFALKHYGKTVSQLSDSERSRCSSLAEFWAYADSIVPDGYSQYNIFDFDGYSVQQDNTKSMAILPEVACNAKDKICQYCWNMGWGSVNEEMSKVGEGGNIHSFLRKHSAMSSRKSSGNNIVIFGSSEKPIGRTMLASIVMKEAIRLRIDKQYRGQSYDWIDFSKLIQSLKIESSGASLDKNNVVYCRSCDWLVVDNISRKDRSAPQLTLLTDLIDPFFTERFECRLPTILVFKFDLRDKSLNMEKTFGIGITKIIKSDKTLKIPLT